jgi:hypothetical protein
MSKSMTFTDAAYRLLGESGEPRHYRWLTEEALHRGWLKTEGKTPEATMYAVLFMEIKNEIPGKAPSRFVRTGRGMFGLAEWAAEQPAEAPAPESEARYFVFIVNQSQGVEEMLSARQIYERLMNLSAWGIGERTPYRKELRSGSHVVFYQAGKGGQRFIGTATIASELRAMSESRAQMRRAAGIEPFRYDLSLTDIDIWKEPKPVMDMLQRLEFIGNKQHFGVHFQGGVKRISEADYYAILEFKPPKSEAKLGQQKRAEYTHAVVQGMLVELGNLLGYDTYSADRSPMYRDTTIGELVTLEALPEFTSKRILNTARQIDVVWLEDEFPVCCFEIEHSTDVTKGLLRMHQLAHFQAQFFIVAPEGTRTKFETETDKSPFYQHRERYFFRSYADVEALYALTKRFAETRDGFLNE